MQVTFTKDPRTPRLSAGANAERRLLHRSLQSHLCAVAVLSIPCATSSDGPHLSDASDCAKSPVRSGRPPSDASLVRCRFILTPPRAAVPDHNAHRGRQEERNRRSKLQWLHDGLHANGFHRRSVSTPVSRAREGDERSRNQLPRAAAAGRHRHHSEWGYGD
jgi:hypothetical protein